MDEVTSSIIRMIHGKKIPGKIKNKSYFCLRADEFCIIFDKTEASGKAMIPTEVAIEWIKAHENEIVYDNYTGKEKVKIIGKESNWSNQHHSFTSHLDAIVRAYQKYVFEKENDLFR